MKLKRILLTGAAGSVGTALRPHLSKLAHCVRLSDVKQIDDAVNHEEFALVDLTDREALEAAVQGCDAVIHLGGVPEEGSWNRILPANIIGTYNLYEAVRAAGNPRVVFASSNHTIGFYPRRQRIGTDVPFRPDTLYGVSKCFGESLASLYHDKFGIETLSLRIGSFRHQPEDRRMLATWVSAADTYGVIARALTTPHLGHTVVYGVSGNSEIWWDNSNAAFLGWTPKDTAEAWRSELFATEPEQDPRALQNMLQGGGFVVLPHPDDET